MRDPGFLTDSVSPHYVQMLYFSWLASTLAGILDRVLVIFCWLNVTGSILSIATFKLISAGGLRIDHNPI